MGLANMNSEGEIFLATAASQRVLNLVIEALWVFHEKVSD